VRRAARIAGIPSGASTSIATARPAIACGSDNVPLPVVTVNIGRISAGTASGISRLRSALAPRRL